MITTIIMAWSLNGETNSVKLPLQVLEVRYGGRGSLIFANFCQCQCCLKWKKLGASKQNFQNWQKLKNIGK